MARPKKSANSYLEQLEEDVKSNQSKLSLILGILIVLVLGVLIFNYFNRQKQELGPAQQTEELKDVSPENLPGKYTVKEGDTLFSIAEKYYQDGYKYTEIAQTNNLGNVDTIQAGQIIEIPKPPSPSPEMEAEGIGGGNTTIWGPKIEGDSYTVVEGDWLSKIAGRAYGDILAYQKIASANNIANPDLIFPGQVLKIPR